MYPHSPPNVTRVSRETVQENGLTASAVMVACSVMQGGEMPVPERVVVRCLPPDGSNFLNPSEGELNKIDEATAVYRQWSPVSSLGELIEFLMDMPERRRQWWSIEANRRGYLQNLRPFSASVTPSMHPTILGQDQMILSSPQRCQKMQHCPSSPCDMEEESVEATIEGSPFVANRFDVGYERGSMVRHWGVRRHF
jgi:hypothetical protein